MNHPNYTEIIDELVEKIMEYNEGLTKEFKQSKITNLLNK